MAEIKYMDIAEFRRLGYLQEANRLFFHPHGLALEVTTVTEGVDEGVCKRVRDALDAVRLAHLLDLAPDDPKLDTLAKAIGRQLAPVGSQRLSGVWDARDDPEGIVFGADPDDKREKAETVREERLRRYAKRSGMFGLYRVLRGARPMTLERLDVEPVDWVAPEGLLD